MVLQFGFYRIHESDLIIRPNPSTYATIPWLEKDSTARSVCDILNRSSFNNSFPRDPRRITNRAKNMLEKKVMMSPIRDQKLNFSVFDKLEVNTMTPYRNQSYMITSKEAPWSTEGVGHALRLKE